MPAAYDLRRPPQLPMLGALVPSGAVQAVRTDGLWAYARLAGSPMQRRAWRFGPEVAFLDAGTTSATGWTDGADVGPRFAVRRSGSTVEVRTW